MLASTSEKVGVKLILFADTLKFVLGAEEVFFCQFESIWIIYFTVYLRYLEVENEPWPVRAF